MPKLLIVAVHFPGLVIKAARSLSSTFACKSNSRTEILSGDWNRWIFSKGRVACAHRRNPWNFSANPAAKRLLSLSARDSQLSRRSASRRLRRQPFSLYRDRVARVPENAGHRVRNRLLLPGNEPPSRFPSISRLRVYEYSFMDMGLRYQEFEHEIRANFNRAKIFE